MTAEAIAKVIADMRDGRIVRPTDHKHVNDLAALCLVDPVVVDTTAVYESLVGKGEVALYEDHPCIAPPFEEAAFCYVNGHGNVVVSHLAATPPHEKLRWEEPPGHSHRIEWDRVGWIVLNFLYVGGYSDTGHRAIPTTGPAHFEQYAIYEDGEPADFHWVDVNSDLSHDEWDMMRVTTLGALNFLNCRNVEIVDPPRPRPERRRMERGAPGVKVHTINVFPVGKTTRGVRGEPVGGVPLHSVRGHFAHYGEQYGRGLLFGKYSGKFYISQFARGAPEAGEVRKDYKLVE